MNKTGTLPEILLSKLKTHQSTIKTPFAMLRHKNILHNWLTYTAPLAAPAPSFPPRPPTKALAPTTALPPPPPPHRAPLRPAQLRSPPKPHPLLLLPQTSFRQQALLLPPPWQGHPSSQEPPPPSQTKILRDRRLLVRDRRTQQPKRQLRGQQQGHRTTGQA